MKCRFLAAPMAESQRKQGEVKTVDEAAHEKAERYTLGLFFFGGIAIVALMFWIAGFLSNGDQDPINAPLVVGIGAAIPATFFFIMSKKLAP